MKADRFRMSIASASVISPQFVQNGKLNKKNLLIMSPHTGVYYVGLSLPSLQEKGVLVQISMYSARELKFIRLGSSV